MKKLMIAAAIVSAAVFANAASYEWKEVNDGLAKPGTESYIADATAYLFDAGVVSQQACLNMFLADGISGYIDGANATMTEDGISTKGFTYNGVPAESILNAYYAVISDGNIFISSIKQTTAQAVSTATLSFGDPWDDSTAPAITTGTYEGQGWYTAVPEPTSGLLLLLGVAGLALRRRRA